MAVRSLTSGHDPDTDVGVGCDILLYDGLCGFCDRTVRFILEHESRPTLRFAALQSSTAAKILQADAKLRDVDSLILVEEMDGETRILVRSDALTRVAHHLRGIWGLARWLRLAPRPVRDVGYDLFARHRHRMFGRLDSCRIPSSDVRGRSLS